MGDENRKTLTPKQAEELLPFSSQTIKAMCREGQLEGFKLRGRWFIYPESIEEVLKAAHNRKA